MGAGAQTFDLRVTVHAVTAVESALLDLLGRHLEVPVAALLGDGQQRDPGAGAGYLFFVGDRAKTDLAYRSPSDEDAGGDEWLRVRHEEALTPEAVVRLAEAAQARYGFADFKLKGGVLPAARGGRGGRSALAERFPDARITLDPNGGWLLDDAIRTCRGLRRRAGLRRGPVGAEGGFSGREVMAEFKRATGLPTATNMIATDWREMGHAIRSGAVDIPLADPHFWTMNGSVRVAQLCDAWGLPGAPLQQPLRYVAGDVHPRRGGGAGRRSPRSTPTGSGRTVSGSQRRLIRSPTATSCAGRAGPGRGLDDGAVAAAHELYLKEGLGGRDDAIAMQYLVPGWTFDSKRPALAEVR